jgi:hypothetical protein
MGSTDVALIVSPEVWTIQNILAPFIGLHDENHHSGDHQQKYACFEKCHLMRAPCFCSCGGTISIKFLKTGSGIRSHSEFRRYCPFTLMGRTRCGKPYLPPRLRPPPTIVSDGGSAICAAGTDGAAAIRETLLKR